MRTIAKTVPSPTFFVFSQDFEWCRKHLSFEHPVVFVEENKEERNYEDLTLMSKCKHHIIANSTFSWWGAWLNPSKKKIVIAPRKWFTQRSKLCAENILPAAWIKL